MKAFKKFLLSIHFITIAFFCALYLILASGIINPLGGNTLKDARASITQPSAPAASPIPLEIRIPDSAETLSEEIFDIQGEIHRGDTLSKSLKRYGVPPKVRARLIECLGEVIDFRKIRPGDRYSIKVDDEEKLLKCVYEISPIESYTLINTDNGYRIERDKKNLETRKIRISGMIDTTLFAAFPADIKTPKLIYAFADIFSSRLDFNTEIRVGDRFSLIVEEYYLFGEFIGYGPVLACKYERSNGELLEAFRYNPGDQLNSYFDRDGRELGSSFLRSPVEIGRLSSSFSQRRKHPISGTVKPHLGIDLAAPRGTRVKAAADGEIVFAGRNGGFGNQIIIAHANNYRTHYGHLAGFKKGLKVGQRVRQKEIIGYVGSTGLSTGPHLDYRMQHNASFKNPLSVKFRPKSVLEGEKLAELQGSISPLISELYTDYASAVLEVGSLVITGDRRIAFL
ncbi:MAG: peptidoglycan DD-metalloendopeptidase family protein [Desulfurivibrionaceae bacterium]